MIIPHKQRTTRGGFTLVELMVVILIIAILVSLISAAVSKALARAKQVRNKTEIGQLAVAVENFKNRFGFYPPSRIKLCENSSDYYKVAADKQLDDDSISWLTRMFPRINTIVWGNPAPTGWMDWNGDGKVDGPMILEGDQCLVFFLSGIRDVSTGVPTGFSTNGQNPTIQGGDRIDAFFTFTTGRLVNKTAAGAIHSAAPLYLSYADNYATTDGARTLITGAPYAYFSSGKTTNGYDRYGSTDCPTLGVSTYFEAAGATGKRYINPTTFQIISAGADGFFGPGGAWTPSGAGKIPGYRNLVDPVTGALERGYDDQSNFYESLLGVGS